MAILKPKQIREMSPQEREEKLQQLRNELAKERAAIASGTRPENPGRIREIRKTIARILTIQNEKKNTEVEKTE
ncbi:MAG: 50S ribosomal protein L29 [Candidatus Diapherotrites archaeon]|nr:50S ribosomal protein L29 [Candidatus Diapherotrites archaeon]